MTGDLAKACFTVLTGEKAKTRIDVHFNPESLELSVTNNLVEQGEGNAAKQYVSQATAKLNFTLIFDTTDTGADVRTHTSQLSDLMGGVPDGTTSEQGGLQKVPAVLRLEWGAFVFQGMIESYKETLDFWSWEGVPLRASVTLGMSRQDRVFEAAAERTGRTSDTTGAVNLPVPPGGGAADAAAAAGNPRAARAVALQNGLGSLRAGVSVGLTVSASASIGATASVGASGAVGLGIGAGVGATGLSGSARAEVGGGRFADLRAPAAPVALPPGRVKVGAPALPAGATFSPGGRLVGGPAGLSADVGIGVSLSDRLRFKEGE